MGTEPLIQVNNLTKYYEERTSWLRPKRRVRAVDGASFGIDRGTTFALVGESGCGKSTMGRTILRLTEPSSGEIWFNGTNLSRLGASELRRMRSRMQMIFQDPYASLNPKKTIRSLLEEPLRIHERLTPGERTQKVNEIMEMVGLSAYHLDRYPHQFSGGQRQRIGIARAVILRPDFIVADEAVSALDVSVQSQVINLLLSLQRSLGLTYLFISHDLGVVRHIADRVAVMYMGQIVEQGETEKLFADPRHPYTRALLSAIPKEHPLEKRERIVLHGDVPNPSAPPGGCRFHPRCPARMACCASAEPEMVQQADGRLVSCHLYPLP